jgi:GNAT superfamily N-acetyltransferase
MLVVNMKIEHAKLERAKEISSLMLELGYEMPLALVEDKLKFIDGSDFDAVFVAVIEDVVVGVISCHLTTLFHAVGMSDRITSLVVSADSRRLGVGAALVQKADSYFNENNCIKAEVTSGDQRIEAHNFYVKQGYAKDQRRFVKLYN